jgi:hypothetical protein
MNVTSNRRFIDEIVGRRNARNAKRLDLERSALQLRIAPPYYPSPVTAARIASLALISGTLGSSCSPSWRSARRWC